MLQSYDELPDPFEHETLALCALSGLSGFRVDELRRRWFQVSERACSEWAD